MTIPAIFGPGADWPLVIEFYADPKYFYRTLATNVTALFFGG